jgi:flagellar biosynthesis protein FliQ
VDEQTLIDLARSTLLTALLLVAPALLVGLLIGLIVSLFQTITSLQEQTLAIGPKLLAVGATLLLLLPWSLSVLREFARLPPTPLERAESIDMLRAIEHGRPVRLVEIEEDTHAVDTAEDLRLVESLMKDDPLIRLYAEPGVRERRRQ